MYIAELYAAMLLIHRLNKTCFVIYSEFLSALQSISSAKIDNPLVYGILKNFTELTVKGKYVVFLLDF